MHPLHPDSTDAFPDVFADITMLQATTGEDTDHPQHPHHHHHHHHSHHHQHSSKKSGINPSSSHHQQNQQQHHIGFSSLQLPSAPHRPIPRNPTTSSDSAGAPNLISGLPVHSSTGARSKVKDSRDSRRRLRDSRGPSAGGQGHHSHIQGQSTPVAGGSGGEGILVASSVQISDFDPLSSGGSSSGSFRGWKKGSSKSSKLNHQAVSSGGENSLISLPNSTSSPRPPSKSSKSGSSPRNSGTDIWVSSNGQLSGNSSRRPPTNGLRSNQSSFDSVSESLPPESNVALASNHSLFQTPNAPPLPPKKNRNSGPKSFSHSTPDEGCFSTICSEISSASTECGDQSSINMSMSGSSSPPPLFNLMSDSGNVSGVTSNSSTPMGVIDKVDFLMSPNKEGTTEEKILAPSLTTSTSAVNLETRKVEDQFGGVDEEGNVGVSFTMGEQQNASLNLDERRLSSAILFDLVETDDCSTNDTTGFFECGSLTSEDHPLSKDVPKVTANGVIVVVDDEFGDEGNHKDCKHHHRQDSSGSNHSAASLKDREKDREAGGDNISLMSVISDDKVSEFEIFRICCFWYMSSTSRNIITVCQSAYLLEELKMVN